MEQVGEAENESFWSASVQSHFWLAFENFLHNLAALNYFFSYIDSIIYPPAILPCYQYWEKARREWQYWLKGTLLMV